MSDTDFNASLSEDEPLSQALRWHHYLFPAGTSGNSLPSSPKHVNQETVVQDHSKLVRERRISLPKDFKFERKRNDLAILCESDGVKLLECLISAKSRHGKKLIEQQDEK
eukprot:767175-Hanusia_phi.AAC.4